MNNFYCIHIIPKQGIPYFLIEKTFNQALDWLRITENFWIVYTNSNAATWQKRLLKHVQNGGELFICKLDVKDRQGWITKVVWEWLNRPRI